MDDRLEDIICDVGVQSFVEVVYEIMSINADTSLYSSLTNFT